MTTIPQVTPCDHLNTVTNANVDSVVGDGGVVRYQLTVRVSCADCGQPFHFPNLIEYPGDIPKTISTRDNASELVVPMEFGAFEPEKN